ncbi:MAG: type II secretion system protein [Kineosporiaceae bacterium]|jgi:type II secretory pathway pseudopilin PulG
MIGLAGWLRPRRRAGEAGFTMMEAVVAMAVFAIMVTAVLAVVLRVTQVARSNNHRVVAASLANRQIESVRGQKATDIPNGGLTRTETIGTTPYTIAQTANYLPSDATTSVCASSGSELAYKLVTVLVTWPDMAEVQPVRADTLIPVGVGSDGLDETKGSVALSVLGADGAPVTGITVTLSPGSSAVTTGSDGCAVFTELAPTTYTATADTTGHVGVTNSQLTTVASIGVSASTVTRATLVYDTDRTVNLEVAGPAGYTLPSGVPLYLRDTYVAAAEYPACTGTGQGCLTGFPGQARSLFPATYDAWAGGCADAVTATTFDLTAASADGSTVAVGTGSALVDVQVGGISTAGLTVYAVHATEPTGTFPYCAAGATYTLPASEVGGVGVLLPYGTWTFSLTSFSPSAAAPADAVTVTLTDSGTENVTLVSVP